MQVKNSGVIPDPIDAEGNCVVQFGDLIRQNDTEFVFKVVSDNATVVENATVLMPLWYWKKVVRYMVDSNKVSE